MLRRGEGRGERGMSPGGFGCRRSGGRIRGGGGVGCGLGRFRCEVGVVRGVWKRCRGCRGGVGTSGILKEFHAEDKGLGHV